MKNLQSAERVSAQDMSDNYVYQRSRLAYHEAAKLVSGDVLEIGTGSGYGISIISPHTKSFNTIDKNFPPISVDDYPNVGFIRMKVPPLANIASNSFDYVITFQVVEHIKNDFLFLSEIKRVLRPGGKLIITTPNKKMSLTRNPWHVREYTPSEFYNLLSCSFTNIEGSGVYGNDKVMEYYNKNKKSVERISRYDIFKIQKWMPRLLLRIPYDIMNRFNRRKLLEKNRQLTSQITMQDYYLAPVNEQCFDLFYIAEKV